MDQTAVTWDQREFDALLAKEQEFTKRTVVESLNTHAYYIARKALWYTKKASAPDVRSGLTRLGLSNPRTTASGRTIQTEAPRGALIINKKRGTLGLPGLWGGPMREAFKELLASRMRSIAFIKSGWLPAIRILDALVKGKSGAGVPMDRAAKVIGPEKGTAIPATEATADPFAIIINRASTADDKKGALQMYGGPGLELAVYDEAQAIKAYTERKLQEQFDKLNAKL